jgi:hypothetical protein
MRRKRQQTNRTNIQNNESRVFCNQIIIAYYLCVVYVEPDFVANPTYDTSEETSLIRTDYKDLVHFIPVELKIRFDKLQFGAEIGKGQRTN